MTRRSEGSVYQRADGRWCAKYRDLTGRWRYLYARTRVDARRKLRDALEQRDAGVGGDNLTLGAWIAWWLDQRDARPTTDADYRYRLGLLPYWLTDLPLGKLTAGHVHEALREIAAAPTATGKPRSASTVAKVRSLLIQALDQAQRWGHVARNVARLTDAPRQEPAEVVPLTRAEADQLLAQVAGHRYESLYLTAVACGLRRGEVLGIRWADIDLEQRRLHVRQQVTTTNRNVLVVGPPKTAKSKRTVALPQVVADALRRRRTQWLEERLAAGELWDDTDLVWPTELGHPTHPRNLLRHLHRTCEAAGVRRISFHTLRHSAATFLLAAGIPERVIMDVLGHSTTAMIARYQHVVDELRRDAADAMDGVLGSTRLGGGMPNAGRALGLAATDPPKDIDEVPHNHQ